jgi:hypothetical protein
MPRRKKKQPAKLGRYTSWEDYANWSTRQLKLEGPEQYYSRAALSAISREVGRPVDIGEIRGLSIYLGADAYSGKFSEVTLSDGTVTKFKYTP